jgi:hypothetical protein|tara:strand:+ start:108 stop:551 length:444 start_codon:yes stop_codon:yes gene_type:complete
MKITKTQLKQIIMEELEKVMNPSYASPGESTYWANSEGDTLEKVRSRNTPPRTMGDSETVGAYMLSQNAQGETAQETAARVENFPTKEKMGAIQQFKNIERGEGMQMWDEYYYHIKDLPAFAKEVLSILAKSNTGIAGRETRPGYLA